MGAMCRRRDPAASPARAFRPCLGEYRRGVFCIVIAHLVFRHELSPRCCFASFFADDQIILNAERERPFTRSNACQGLVGRVVDNAEEGHLPVLHDDLNGIVA